MKQGLRLSNKELDGVIDLALAEDVSYGDVTSQALIPPELQGRAAILAKEEGILAGIEVVKRVFLKVNVFLKMKSVPFHFLFKESTLTISPALDIYILIGFILVKLVYGGFPLCILIKN